MHHIKWLPDTTGLFDPVLQLVYQLENALIVAEHHAAVDRTTPTALESYGNCTHRSNTNTNL